MKYLKNVEVVTLKVYYKANVENFIGTSELQNLATAVCIFITDTKMLFFVE